MEGSEFVDDKHRQFICDVFAEIEHAESKHGFFPADAIHASAIINEEAGKLTQACIDHTYGPDPTLHDLQERRDRMYKKAVSTAAMAIRFAEAMPTY